MPRAADARILAAVMFTDIVDSTAVASRIGDARWKELIARHHAIVRRELKRFGGKELDTAGDGFFASFKEPAAAIRCALAASDAVRELGIEIRAGVHFGECEQVGNKLGGIAVVVGARVMSLGGAGDVLVTASTRDLVAGGGFGFADRGDHSLKGVEATWRVFAVVDVDGVPVPQPLDERKAVQLLEAVQPTAVGSRGRLASHRALVGVAILVVLGLVALVVPSVRSRGGPIRTANQGEYEPGLAFFEADTAAPIHQIPMNQPFGHPFFDDGMFWVRDPDNSVYVAIDATTHEISARVPVPTGYADAEDGRLYVGDFNAPTLTVIDVASERVLRTFTLPVEDGDTDGSSGVLVSNGSIWVQHRDEVLRIDPESGRRQARIPGIGFGLLIEAEDGTIWTASDAGLVQIDPATNESAATFNPGTGFGSVASQGGAIWTADEAKGIVYKVDPRSGEQLDTYEADEGSRYLAAGDGNVWVANQDVGSVTVIDAVTGARETYPMGHLAGGVAVGGGEALITIPPGKTFEDEIASLEGDVAKVLVPGYAYTALDPATVDFSQNPLQRQLADATCARLLRYPERIDPAGWRLEPEVATDLPTVSADGRTYTFHIGEGFAFSPPSNEAITAETFAYSIERALSPVFGEESPASSMIDDIVGMAAYRDGAAEHIAGIRAGGDTLSITIREPSDTFLDRLVFPAFCPVPLDTPIVAGGVNEPPSFSGRQPLAMSGPFFASYHLDGELTILERNPNYGGPREAPLDAIALREGLDPSIGIGRVEDGSWDLTLNPDPSLEPGGIIDTAWGPGSPGAEAGDQRYHPVTLPGSMELAMNAGRPLFADERVRRAVALALSRDDAAAAAGNAVAGDALVISGLPGAPAEQIFDGAGDPDAATEVMGSAKGGDAVFAYAPECGECPSILSMMEDRLAPLRITVRGEVMDDPYGEYFSGHASFDMILTYTSVDFADGTTFLGTMIGGIPPDWLPPGVLRSVEALERLTGDARDRATAALAEELSRSTVPAVALARYASPAYFSPSLGCRVFPAFGAGPDLASLCLVDTG
jgi:class 3 adenylate cyclase/ABC-type transport system substrate-binding protein/streptogramin lyase